MHLTIEKCTDTFLDDLVHLSKKTFIEAFEAVNNPKDFKAYIDFAFEKGKIHQELLCKDSAFYFVRQHQEVVGYFKINWSSAQTDIQLKESMELERIYVLQSFQGQRIGEWILEEVKRIALKMGKQFVWLGVWQKNLAAVRFYERHGFVKFGTHPYYIGSDKQTDWLMRYDI